MDDLFIVTFSQEQTELDAGLRPVRDLDQRAFHLNGEISAQRVRECFVSDLYSQTANADL